MSRLAVKPLTRPKRPLITDAVLLILSQGHYHGRAYDLAQIINSWDEFKPLRDYWHTVSKHQVYAAMSGLRSKTNPDINMIVPVTGRVGLHSRYRITEFGRQELARRIKEGRFTLMTEDKKGIAPDPHTGQGDARSFDETPVPPRLSGGSKLDLTAGIPKEHPYLHLDQEVRIININDPWYGHVAKISNIILGDRHGIYVDVPGDPDAAPSRTHIRGGTTSHLVYEGDIVPLQDEHERLIGDWAYTARIHRDPISGIPVRGEVTGPLIRKGEAVFREFSKHTPTDQLNIFITNAFEQIVAPKLIERCATVEGLAAEITAGKLDL